MKGIDHIQREEQDSILFFLIFTLLYRVQYFLTLLLLVKRAGAGQIQSWNRNQVKLNFLELLAKENPLLLCTELQEPGHTLQILNRGYRESYC